MSELRADAFYTSTLEPLVVSKFEELGKKEEAYINVSLAGERVRVAILAQHQVRMGNNSVEDGLGAAVELATSSAAPAAATGVVSPAKAAKGKKKAKKGKK